MSPPNLWNPPGRPIVPPSVAEWQEILREGGEGLMRSPYEQEHRLDLARALFHHGYHYEARHLLSGKLVPIIGRDLFPSKVPSVSIFDAAAGNRGITVHPVTPISTARDWIPASVGIEPLPDCLRARPRWKRDHFVASVVDGRCVASPHGYAVFARDGSYLDDFCDNDGAMIPFTGVVPPSKKIRGTVALFLHYCSHAVFHWTMETLPRFELLRLAQLIDQVDYFALREIHPWHIEFLDRLGIAHEKLIALGSISHIEADELLVCSNVEQTDFSIYPGYHEPEPWVTDFLARVAPPTPESAGGRRIYISREKAGCRQTSNAVELRHFLHFYGFETVFFEDMSFSEKALVLRSAEIVISPTGAALTYVPLMQAGSKCIVLYCSDGVYAGKNVICANSNVTHIHSISPALSRFQPEAMKQMPEHMRQITVDLRNLRELFELCGISERQV